MTSLGGIRQIWLHPVKSMRGLAVDAAELKWNGLAGDRRYAFVRADDSSSFPWLTGRAAPQLIRYTPSLDDPQRPRACAVRVTKPDGRTLDVENPELSAELEKLYGGPLTLLHAGRGAHDSSPVSLIGAATIAKHCAQAALEPNARRFRNNFVIEGSEPLAEDGWIGRVLQLGDRAESPQLRIDRRNERCVMITLDPETTERTVELLTHLALERESCAGVYASVVRPGVARAGDAVLAL